MLFIISDIDAFYDDNPKTNKNAKPIDVVKEIKDEWLIQECNPNDDFATGGIVTKLKAAKFLMERGKPMFLTSGENLEAIEEFLKGKKTKGTLFMPKEVA